LGIVALRCATFGGFCLACHFGLEGLFFQALAAVLSEDLIVSHCMVTWSDLETTDSFKLIQLCLGLVAALVCARLQSSAMLLLQMPMTGAAKLTFARISVKRL
jgi:hypothetical protein